MWFLNNINHSKVISQLSMKDSEKPKDCALYKLSEHSGMEFFKHLILVSSYQDHFAPYDSARIQISSDAAQDQSKGNEYINMAENLLGKDGLETVYRLDVNFNIEETNLDTIMGRKAHILFLENHELLTMIITRYKSFFS